MVHRGGTTWCFHTWAALLCSAPVCIFLRGNFCKSRLKQTRAGRVLRSWDNNSNEMSRVLVWRGKKKWKASWTFQADVGHQNCEVYEIRSGWIKKRDSLTSNRDTSRLFIPVPGSAAFSLQTSCSTSKPPLLADHGLVVWFHVRVQLLCSHMSKWTEPKRKTDPGFGATSPADPLNTGPLHWIKYAEKACGKWQTNHGTWHLIVVLFSIISQISWLDIVKMALQANPDYFLEGSNSNVFLCNIYLSCTIGSKTLCRLLH